MVSLFARSLFNKQIFFFLSIMYIYSLFHQSGSSFFKTTSVSFVVVAANINEEAEALIKWKLGLDNKSQHFQSSRQLEGNRSSSHCSWLGVGCNESKRLTHLSLSNSNLSGTLQNLSFSSFSNLVSIDFVNNYLYGDILLSIYSLSKLTHLKLEANSLTRFLSPAVANLSCLSYLSLSGNPLSGTIPREVGLMTGLSALYLARNLISGTIPKEIGNFKSLTILALDNSYLTGSIPSSTGNLTNLVCFYLFNTQIYGNIPTGIGNLTK
nr:probable leucine-rich repeat receptor-like protein kinase At1g35710 [Ziziphus jujuba var. spinosa]